MSSSPSSVSSSSTSSFAPSPSPSHLSPFRSRKFTIKLILAGLSFLIFGVSLIFAIAHWRRQQLNSLRHWTSQACNILSKTFQSNPSNSSQFRITAQVTILPLSQETLTAYYGPNSDYNLSRQQAQQALAKIPTNTTCYVSNDANAHVSLISVPSPQSRSSSIYIAWTATVVAAVMAVILFTFLSHILHKFNATHLASPSVSLTTPSQAETPFLTSRQTKFVCQNYAQDVHRAQIKDWVCSICLEDHPNDSVVKSVQLPCQHSYHQRCIQEWLRKGKSVCPLCNWDVKSLFKNTPHDSQNYAQHVGPVIETGEELSIDDGIEADRNVPRTS